MLILKGIIQNFLLGFPAIKHLAWKGHTTGINNDPEKVAALWKQLADLATLQNRHVAGEVAKSSLTGKNVLEIGPGRTDALLYLAQKSGADAVSALDVYPYLDSNKLLNNHIIYKIYTGKIMPFESNSFDLIWSNDTFEHLKYPTITVNELSRILKKDGIAMLNIDLSDHYAQGKSEKVLFNCLKYPEWLWKLMTSNRSAFVNRLRYNNWMQLFTLAGLEVIQENTSLSEVILKCINNKELAYLMNYSENDAITSYLSVIVRKP